MLIHLILKYLESHKRLVIPQLGAFIVKDPGRSVVFSELLKRDDGVLRGELCAAGATDVEAAGEIDRFVFEVRHALEQGEEVLLDGWGVLRAGENGSIHFEYDPLTVAPHAEASPALEESEQPATPPFTIEKPQPDAPAEGLDDAEIAAAEAPEAEAEIPAEAASASAATPAWSEAARERFATSNPHLSKSADDPATDSVQGMQIVPDELHVSPSVKMHPEPCLKGLRYGKPKKNTNAYTFVDHRGGRRRVDRFLLVAVAAALIAVAAIAFGYYRASQERKMQTEQSVPMTEPAPQPENPQQ